MSAGLPSLGPRDRELEPQSNPVFLAMMQLATESRVSKRGSLTMELTDVSEEGASKHIEQIASANCSPQEEGGARKNMP